MEEVEDRKDRVITEEVIGNEVREIEKGREWREKKEG